MIRLSPLLLEVSKSDIIKNLKYYFEYVSKKYFGGHSKYPYPTFKLKTNLGKIGSYVPSRNEFVLDIDFANDYELLKATIFHETIHYFQVHQFGFDNRKLKMDGYHDDYFHTKAREINSGEGKKYVTVLGTFQAIKTGKSVKPFWVYVMDKQNDEINWMWSPTKNEKAIDLLKRISDYYHYKGVKAFQTDEISFKEAPRFSGKARYGVIQPNDPDGIYNKIYPIIKQQKYI